MRRQQRLQVGGGLIGADQADHPHLGLQADDLHGHVGSAAGHLELVGHVEDLNGCLGAEPIGITLDVVVEHHVADHRDLARPQSPDQPLELPVDRAHGEIMSPSPIAR